MKRELFIVLGVLVPFGVLVALGFVFTRQGRPDEAQGPAAVPVGSRPTATAARPSGAPDAGRPTALGDERSPIPAELAVPLAAVTPEVLLCFRDQRAHLRGPQRLVVSFRPTVDGGFDSVRVPSMGDPFLQACIEDVFDELRFEPSGAETFRPAAHTFRFEP